MVGITSLEAGLPLERDFARYRIPMASMIYSLERKLEYSASFIIEFSSKSI
jgi:hypothetical protein